MTAKDPELRIGILVVAYNAASTLHDVLDRIPADFRHQIAQVLVSDDASGDATYLVGLGYQQISELPLTVIRQPRNLGYGGNQKAGYQWAIDGDLDVIVLLHGDGQYAPELLPQIVAPIERDEADAVMGSRMMARGAALRGGMPRYKYVGNRILTTFENAVMATDLSEWHSGYRAYRVDALRRIPFQRNSDGFDFDTQIIVQLIEAEQRIAEIPIPTYYGDEISHVNGIRYAWDISRHVTRYRLHKMGFGSGELAFAASEYEEKPSADSSHGVMDAWVQGRARGRVLELGCASGTLGGTLRQLGHDVTGVDIVESPGVRQRLTTFVHADLDQGLPDELTGPFDLVLAGDVFEHLRRPEALLVELRKVLAPSATIIASVPNVAHWYPRLRFASGHFDYDRRGILDRGHLRFFTRASFARLARTCGYEIMRSTATGLPLDVVDRGADKAQASGARQVIGTIDHLSLTLWPNLFAYQWVFELRPTSARR